MHGISRSSFETREGGKPTTTRRQKLLLLGFENAAAAR